MRFSTRTRVLVAAATVGGLSLTAGCFVPGGGAPPVAGCTDAQLIRSQAQLDAIEGTIELKQEFLETNGQNIPESLYIATQDAIEALQEQADSIQAHIDECNETSTTIINVQS